MKKAFASAVIALGMTTVPASAANLLVNGSFESGFTGWTLGGSSGDPYPPVVIPYNVSSPYPGGAFNEVIPTDNAIGNPGFDPVGESAAYFVADLARPQTLEQIVNVVAGVNYTFGFDVYLPANGAGNVNDATLTATVAGLPFAALLASATPTTSWLHFSSSATAAVNGTVNFAFTFNSNGVPAKDFVIDRVYLAPTASVPEASTWLMMIFGFGVVGGALRRRSAGAVATTA